MDPMIITVALNEGITKDTNPAVPLSPEEIARDAIACARAGASIIHFHPRHPQTGENLLGDSELYARAYRLIQAESDVLLFPSYPPNVPKEQRIAHVLELVEDPSVRFELMTWDVGSINGARAYDSEHKTFLNPDFVLINTHADITYLLQTCNELGVTCSLGARDVGHLRHIGAYVDMGLVSPPIALNLFFRDLDVYGMAPTAKGLQMFLDMVPAEWSCQWFVASQGPSHGRMNMLVAASGGHIRTGLGDNPIVDGERLTNVTQVERAADLAQRAGREVATPEQARKMMGILTVG